MRKNSILSGGLACAAGAVIGLAFFACSEKAPEELELLRIAVLPDEEAGILEKRYARLVSYMERQCGVPCQLIVPGSYEALVDSFANGEADLCWFGGYTYVSAEEPLPLVCRARDRRFTSYFLTRAGNSGQNLDEFRGQRLAFGSRLSTSGHLMPRHFLQSWGIDPESFFGAIRFMASHDETALAVVRGEADLGVANSAIVEAMFDAGRLSRQDVRIVKQTPPYMNYVWACRNDLPARIQNELIDAFLGLSPHNVEHREILEDLQADYFLPVHDTDFKDLRAVIEQLSATGRMQ